MEQLLEILAVKSPRHPHWLLPPAKKRTVQNVYTNTFLLCQGSLYALKETKGKDFVHLKIHQQPPALLSASAIFIWNRHVICQRIFSFDILHRGILYTKAGYGNTNRNIIEFSQTQQDFY